MSIARSVLLTLAVAVVLTVAPEAPAGGISDETCPNVAGEHTNTCPAATVGVPYSITFEESEGSGCGPGRQTFHFDSGILPPGMTLAANGTLSGTSFQPGSFRFYVEMREPGDDPANCAGKRTQKQFTLKVRKLPWIISPTVAPPAEIGVPFRMTLRARGGSGMFAWSLASGRLPNGLRVFADGAVEGTPRSGGTARIRVQARDSENRTVAGMVELAIAPRLRLLSRHLPRAIAERSYRADLATVGGVGRTTWKLTHGRLPRGLRLDSRRGRLTGSPTEAGTHLFAVEVTDTLGVTAERAFRIVVGKLRRDS